MPKLQPKRLDWFKLFPGDLLHGTKEMTNEEFGAYVRLLCNAWLNVCSLSAGPARKPFVPASERGILACLPLCQARSWKKIAATVLAKFKTVTVDGMELLMNSRLSDQFDEAVGKSDSARESNQQRGTIVGANGERSRAPIEVELEEKEEDSSKTDLAFLDEGSTEQTIVEKNLTSLPPGTPGRFARGQYPGTKPRDVWKHASQAWARVKGEAAVSRFPGRFPGQKTSTWEDLCDLKSGDLIVPAFELWAAATSYKQDFPVAEFAKEAGKWLSKVIPLNAAKPEMTATEEAAIVKRGNEAQQRMWSAPAAEADEGDGSELFAGE